MLLFKKLFSFLYLIREREISKTIQRLDKFSIEDLINIIENENSDIKVKETGKKYFLKFTKKEVKAKINKYWEDYLTEHIKMVIYSQEIPKSYLLREHQMIRLIKKVRKKEILDKEKLGNATPRGWYLG